MQNGEHFVKRTIGFLLLLVSGLVLANPDNGPQLAGGKYYTTSQGDRIFFRHEVVNGFAPFTSEGIDAAVQADIEFACGVTRTHIWDNRSYWNTLEPEHKSILYYYNETRNTFGWLAVQHNGHGWEYLLSNGEAGSLETGDDFKVGWDSGGSRVVFAVGVPNGNGSWEQGEYSYRIGW